MHPQPPKPAAQHISYLHLFADIAPIYRDAGLFPFPVRTDGSKIPAIRGWKQAAIRQSSWMYEKFGDHNVGFLCGRAGRIAIADIDTREKDWLVKYQKIFGETSLAVATSRGGHLYYLAEDQHPSRSHTGIDIKADRGFVLAPLSTRPDGPDYSFVIGSLKTFSQDVSQLPHMKPEAFDRYCRVQRQKARQSSGIRADRAAATVSKVDLRRLASDEVTKGQRHNWLLLRAVRIAHRCGSERELADQLRQDGLLFSPPYSTTENLLDIGGIAGWTWNTYIRGDLRVSGEQFATVSRSILEKGPLGNELKLLLWLDLNHGNLRDTFAVAQKEVSKAFSVDQKTIGRWIKRLEDGGYLHCVIRGGYNGGSPKPSQYAFGNRYLSTKQMPARTR